MSKLIEQVLSNHELPLHIVVKEMINFDGLYDFLKENPAAKSLVMDRVQSTINGFNEGLEEFKYMLHRTLMSIYETNLYTPDKKPVFNQFDLVPFVETNPDSRYEIVKGAFFRLHTSLDYVNMLYHRFTNKLTTV